MVDLRVPQRRTLVVEGEPIAFTVETEQPAYLVMLGIDPAATVSVLYPYDPDALPVPVRPDTPLLVPTGERSSELRVTFPFGVEHIVIAAIKSRPAGLMRLAGRQIDPHSPLRPDLERIFAAAEKDGAKASLRFTTVGRLPSRHER